jgi:hypothetical protein
MAEAASFSPAGSKFPPIICPARLRMAVRAAAQCGCGNGSFIDVQSFDLNGKLFARRAAAGCGYPPIRPSRLIWTELPNGGLSGAHRARKSR